MSINLLFLPPSRHRPDPGSHNQPIDEEPPGVVSREEPKKPRAYVGLIQF